MEALTTEAALAQPQEAALLLPRKPLQVDHGGSTASGTDALAQASCAITHTPARPPQPPQPPQPQQPPQPRLSWRCRLLGGERQRSIVLINAASIAERLDEQLLPALYRFVASSFHATPQQLGMLTFSRAVVQALASPVAGLLGHWVDRVKVIAAGALLWGAMCMAFAASNSVTQAIPFWATNGVGLAMLIPAAQSMTADYHAAQERGRAFGVLYLTGAAGALVGALFATNVGGTRPLSIDGWRFAFVTVGLTSWLFGACTLLFGVDPRNSSDPRHRVDKPADVQGRSWRSTLGEVTTVLCVPSFGIIILQGIVGTFPWLALVFITLYFQLLGMSDLQSSLLLATFLGASAAGGLIGGIVGDWAARRWPNHGRVAVCQLSVSVGVPLSALLFKGLPMRGGAGACALYALLLLAAGLSITWAATACNNPVFAEIVPGHLQNAIYAFYRSFEGAVAACAAPLVGWLARVGFGFTGSAEVSGDAALDKEKAASLGSALLVFTALPWTLCALFFTPLHWTYPRDRRRAEQRAAAVHAAVLEATEARVQLVGTADEGTGAHRSSGKLEEDGQERVVSLAASQAVAGSGV